MPTHYVHHAFNMWHYNFGMTFDIWDRVFGTYKPVANGAKSLFASTSQALEDTTCVGGEE